MPDDANLAIQTAREKRDKFWDGISERTRTLCLGALVLVWSVLTQKKAEPILLFLSDGTKLLLLGIALLAVAVIGLDLMEYLAGFQQWRKLAGEDERMSVRQKKIDYAKWQDRIRKAKLTLGLSALLALIIVLGYSLLSNIFPKVFAVSTVHAQEFVNNAMLGKWCGGNANEGKYICVQIVRPVGPLEVKLSFQGKDGWVPCKTSEVRPNSLLARCGKGSIRADLNKAPSSRTEVVLVTTLTVGDFVDQKILHKYP